MTIHTTQLAMGYSQRASGGELPTCSSCDLSTVTKERQGTFPAGSLRCVKGGFMTAPLARCNSHQAVKKDAPA